MFLYNMSFEKGQRVTNPRYGEGTIVEQQNGDVVYLGEVHVDFDSKDRIQVMSIGDIKPAE